MTAIATLIACLASVAIGTGMVRVLSQFKDCRSARWRHLAGSMAFWILAVFPFAFSSTDNSFPSDAVLAGVAGEVLPGALPAQQWMTQASLVFLGAWALWAAASVMLFCLRFRQANPRHTPRYRPGLIIALRDSLVTYPARWCTTLPS